MNYKAKWAGQGVHAPHLVTLYPGELKCQKIQEDSLFSMRSESWIPCTRQEWSNSIVLGTISIPCPCRIWTDIRCKVLDAATTNPHANQHRTLRSPGRYPESGTSGLILAICCQRWMTFRMRYQNWSEFESPYLFGVRTRSGSYVPVRFETITMIGRQGTSVVDAAIQGPPERECKSIMGNAPGRGCMQSHH